MILLKNKLLITGFIVCHILPGFSEPYTKKLSELIEDLVNYDSFLNTTFTKVKEVMDGLEDDFEELYIKAKPHAETFEKIKNQTEFYESIIDIRIPDDEDSKTFATFSLAELMIISVDLAVIQTQYLAANRKMEDKWNLVLKDVTECRRRLKFFKTDEFYEPLANLQIYFEPVDVDNLARQNRPRPAENMTTDKIMKIVFTELLPLINIFEDTKIADDEPPYFDLLKDIINLRHTKFLKDLMDHIEIYDLQYQTVFSQWMDKIEQMEFILTDTSRLDPKNSIKWQLEDVAMGIEKEVPDLIKRIKDLSVVMGIRSYKDIDDEDEDMKDKHDEL